MRRGLIEWSKDEIPEAVLAGRVMRAQAAMHANGLDALVIYTNHTRPSSASWFTGFVPYWSEGLVVVPKDGMPTILAALSKRVGDWIGTTARVAGVTSAPRFASEAGRLVATATERPRLGVVDASTFPSGLAADLREASGGAIVDATEIVSMLRAASDDTEIALATHAAGIARNALLTVDPGVSTALRAVSGVERAARTAGAEEIYVAVAPDLQARSTLARVDGDDVPLGGSFAIRASVAYKGAWVRVARTVVRDDGAEMVAEAERRFEDAIDRLPSTAGIAAFDAWLIEGSTRSQPLVALAGSALAPVPPVVAGTLLNLQATIEVAGSPMVFAVPVAVASSGNRPLVSPVF